MNIEKAIEYFKQRIEHIEEYLGTYGDVYGDYDLTAEEEKALETLGNEKLVNYKAAISALEKQVAKKVEKEHCGQSFGEPTYCGECPNCGWTVASAKNHPYELKNNEHCGRCGQKLDWEGDE